MVQIKPVKLNMEPTQTIRILHVFASLDRGGAETFVMNLYRHIDRSIVQFDFIKMVDATCSYEEEIHSLGGKVYLCPKPHGSNVLSFRRWWNTFFAEHHEYHVIHVHFFTVAGIFLDIAKKNGVITICHSHNASNNKTSTLIVRVMSWLAERNADYCFACSTSAGGFFFPHRKYFVINNAIDVGRYQFDPVARNAKRKELRICDDDIVIGHVGRFDKQKNHFFLLRCFSLIHSTFPHTKLLLVGDGELQSQIKFVASELGLSNSIIFTGVSSEVPNLLSAMDVFMFPSFFEGLGIALVEAQANGLHCIASTGVPVTADLTGNCIFLDLDEKLWKDTFLAVEKSHSTNAWMSVMRAGYDINVSAKSIQEFYLCIAQEKTRFTIDSENYNFIFDEMRGGGSLHDGLNNVYPSKAGSEPHD